MTATGTRDGTPAASSAAVPTGRVAALFTPEAKRQRWLEVEAALALAEADAGMVPREAADAIAAHARLELLDYQRMRADEAISGHVMMPVIDPLAEAAGPEHGGWVHWGATTQNIQQSGDTVGIAQAHRLLVGRLEQVLRRLAGLAEEHADTLMAGRTHGQQAVPITFGYKAAVWADRMADHLERLRQAEPRLAVAMLGGAAGTFATFGAAGPEIQRGLAARLGLAPMRLPARTQVDHFAEWVCILGLVAATAQAIAEEVVRLMSTELAEASEALSDGDVGSSTMPQKRNAKQSMAIYAAAAQVRALVPAAIEATVQAHEVDGARTALMDRVVEQAAALADEILERLELVLCGLRVHPERMRRNLALTGGLISAEAVMMKLAGRLGRQRAHAVVHHAARQAAESGEDFSTVLGREPALAQALDADAIDALLDPARHVGLCAELARQTAQRVRQLLSPA